jgi:hypothetical protein
MSAGPPLRLLHSPGSLVASKLASLRSISTADLLESLRPGTPDALRVKPDGTIMNGNHRIAVLLERGVDVHALPREALGPGSGE